MAKYVMALDQGTTSSRAILFDPLTFIEKLCALVPPPRANLVTDHGVLAPNAQLREAVIESVALLTLVQDCPAPSKSNRPTSMDV